MPVVMTFYKPQSMVKDSDDVKEYFKPEQLEKWNKEHKVENDPKIDSCIIETNTRRLLSALVFASVFPPKNTMASVMFPQVNERIMHPAETVGNFYAHIVRKTAQFSQKTCKTYFRPFRGPE